MAVEEFCKLLVEERDVWNVAALKSTNNSRQCGPKTFAWLLISLFPCSDAEQAINAALLDCLVLSWPHFFAPVHQMKHRNPSPLISLRPF